MPIIETVEQLAEFLEQNDDWRRRLFAILVPRSLQRMPDDLDEFREETRNEFASVRAEMRQGFARVDREFEDVRAEMRQGFERVEGKVKKNSDDIGDIKGVTLEIKTRHHARSRFGVYLKSVKVLDLPDLEDELEEIHPLSDAERKELSNVDLLVRGLRRGDRRDLILVAEISWVVDASDVERAVRRAQIIAQRGLMAVPVAVAGGEITPEARALAQANKCVLLIDGQFENDSILLEGSA